MYIGELNYIGGAGFTADGITAEVRFSVLAQGQLVRIDVNADGISDMDILVASSGLSGGAGDFVL